MNLSFTDLFSSNLDNQQSDFQQEVDEQSDYKRDETGEHYLSEYGDRNVSQTDSPPSEDESEKHDRFSYKGHFYDQDNHDRFDRNKKAIDD